jgi:hypothetical protein
LFFIFSIAFEKSIHVNDQNNIHHIAIVRNDSVQLANSHIFTVVPSSITHRTSKNNARAVQSLNKLSHSNIKANLLGAHILLNIDNTATGSVADISVQKSKHTINGISNHIKGKRKNSSSAITSEEIISQTTAKEPIVFQFFIISL